LEHSSSGWKDTQGGNRRTLPEKEWKAKWIDGFFSVYQKVLKKFVKRLSEEDREKYGKMAQEWTKRSPPEAVQQR
jgi:hypothetical protein